MNSKTKKRILILMYHLISRSVHHKEQRYAVSPVKFREQMKYLKVKGYNPISLKILSEYFCNGKDIPEKSVVISFDDGFTDNYTHAFSILNEYYFPGAVFVVSELVGKTNKWMLTEGYPERPLMGWREIKELQSYGVTIGSHTSNHYRISHLSESSAKSEISDSKKLLEDRLGQEVHHFAYPYGDINESLVNMVQESGYKTACSTKPGFNTQDMNIFKLRRIEVCGTDSILQFAIKLAFGTNDGSLFLPVRYYMKRLAEKVI